MTVVEASGLRPIEWRGESAALLDRTRLTSEEMRPDFDDYRQAAAIQEARVRGARLSE